MLHKLKHWIEWIVWDRKPVGPNCVGKSVICGYCGWARAWGNCSIESTPHRNMASKEVSSE